MLNELDDLELKLKLRVLNYKQHDAKTRAAEQQKPFHLPLSSLLVSKVDSLSVSGLLRQISLVHMISSSNSVVRLI